MNDDKSKPKQQNQELWNSFFNKEPSATKPVVTPTKTIYETDIFDFRYGDGVDAVFYVEGSFTHSYVSKAWDFGRSRRRPPRSWEYWEHADEESQQLSPDLVARKPP